MDNNLNPFPWKVYLLSTGSRLLFFLLLSLPWPGRGADFGRAAEEILWPDIASHLNVQPADLPFISKTVEDFCNGKPDCLYSSYEVILYRLERRFNLPAAIYVGKEIAEAARQHQDRAVEARAYMNLNRFYAAIGNQQQAVANIEKARALFEQLGNRTAVVRAQMSKLEQSLEHRPLEDVLPEMNALLSRAEADGDSISAQYLHIRLIDYCLRAKRYEEVEQHVSALEKVPLSDPIRPNEYGIAIHAAMGRGDLARLQGKHPLARKAYLQALRLCEAEPSRWLEIYVLHLLTELEWEGENRQAAKSYLARAHAKAAKMGLSDLLTRNFELQAAIAEAEARYADALAFTKKKIYHDSLFKSRSEGFDVENYYLLLEKEELAAAKNHQELELQLRKNQLRDSWTILGLALVLLTVVAAGFISQRRREQELAARNAIIQRQAKRLENLDAAKARFFTNVSHELRTPLTLMLGPIRSLLKENRLTERQSRLLRMTRQSGKELERLINQILDLRKLEVGRMEVHPEETRIPAFFQPYLAQFESQAQRKGIAFSYAIMPDLVARIDREKCRQLLYNLLSNAFKFTPGGGAVDTRIAVKDGTLTIAVTDTGRDIHPDDLPHLFDRYYQTNDPDRPAEGGTGIGLALCHEYAHLMGGEITVESRPGKGSVFQVAFPVIANAWSPMAQGVQEGQTH